VHKNSWGNNKITLSMEEMIEKRESGGTFVDKSSPKPLQKTLIGQFYVPNIARHGE